MKRYVTAIFLLFFVALVVITQYRSILQVSPRQTNDLTHGIVSWVADGDTIELQTGEFVRLIGIDAPETGEGKTKKACYGKEAKEFLTGLVTGKSVRLVKDVSEADRYGRLLRYVYLEDVLINAQLVSQGFAWAKAYPPDIREQQMLFAKESEAKKQNHGLWGACY